MRSRRRKEELSSQIRRQGNAATFHNRNRAGPTLSLCVPAKLPNAVTMPGSPTREPSRLVHHDRPVGMFEDPILGQCPTGKLRPHPKSRCLSSKSASEQAPCRVMAYHGSLEDLWALRWRP
ncbi:hypothetical protein VFPPC_17535 [Pochonia chlamydosporia 170]|uniref:Uncharacterized protein n=1 Tax=Pochonia chlamydosporia 170 TaxID=1380566 RepID=A0A219ARQ5_METCM|nr:hypothetical protein VFPPC_17535 [Pochonia chlamydosporia 170]OWT43302.1 hypothetical protein VFPPC_17535 [Pochonia chlamydosporia 170]